jgi:hypothetical protein
VLLPAFDAWLSGGAAEAVDENAPPKVGTLDWVFAEYRRSRRGGFPELSPRQKRNHEMGFRLVSKFKLADGGSLGTLAVNTITTNVVDDLYEKLLVVKETDAAGNTIERERKTTVNHAMKSWRRAWNVAKRAHPNKMPNTNPFAAMGLKSSDRETPTATFAELQAFRSEAVKLGLSSLASAALHGWENLQRVEDIFGTFEVNHYRPKERPNAMRVVHEKTGEESWVPLFDEKGVPLYPELMAELDEIKRHRIGGLVSCRDWGDARHGRHGRTRTIRGRSISPT